MADGGCLCGAIRFATDGAPKWTSYCHCASCRRHIGAPVSAYAGFERTNVRFTKGALARFSSSPGVHRGFCSTCGSTLTYEGERWPSYLCPRPNIAYYASNVKIKCDRRHFRPSERNPAYLPTLLPACPFPTGPVQWAANGDDTS